MRSLAFGVVLLALVGCGDDDPPAPSGEVVWDAAFDTSSAGSLSSVWGSGPDDVFVVGGTDAGAEIYHYDGASWDEMDAPAVPLLVWLHGFGPDDVYAVGTEGGMAHFDGASWASIDTGTDEDLWGIFGFASNDIWIVGGDPFDNDPIILHYDGSTFTPHAIDATQNPQGANALFKVWGIDGDLYAVGQKGLILRYDGNEWLAQPAGAEADQDFVSLWGTSPDHIVAVGGRSNARIATYDGESWSTVSPTALGGLNGVHMAEPGTAVIGGILGMVGSFDVTTGEVTREGPDVPLTRTDMHAVWGDGQGTHWAVGGTFLDPHVGAVLVRSVQ